MNRDAVYVRKGTTVIEVLEEGFWCCGCMHRLGDGTNIMFRHDNSVTQCPLCSAPKPEPLEEPRNVSDTTPEEARDD